MPQPSVEARGRCRERGITWLAYIRPEADKPSVWNLWVQPAAGGTARRVTNYRYGQTWASWFPDDRRIAYSHEDALVVMDLQTGDATRYRMPVKGQLVRTPAVSPDGTKIIFQVFRHGAWLLDLADRSMHRVLTDPAAEEFAWTPDGHRVASTAAATASGASTCCRTVEHSGAGRRSFDTHSGGNDAAARVRVGPAMRCWLGLPRQDPLSRPARPSRR